jgi:hypothetical protein
VRVSGAGRGIMEGEGVGVGGRGMRRGPWVVVAYIFRVVEVEVGGGECSNSSNAWKRWKMEKVEEIWSCIYTFRPPAGEVL